MSERKKSPSTRKEKKTQQKKVENVNILLGKWSNAIALAHFFQKTHLSSRQWLFARFTVFITVLSSYVGLLGHFVCVCVCSRFLLSFQNGIFPRWTIFIETETHPEHILHACTHTLENFLFFTSIFFCLLLRIFSVVFCSSSFHWPRFNCNANCVCLYVCTWGWGREQKKYLSTHIVEVKKKTKPKLSKQTINDKTNETHWEKIK